MPKPTELTITCGEVRIVPKRNNIVTLTLEDPEMDGLLKNIPWDHVVEFVRGEQVGPDEVFTDEQLEKWAEANGYIKQ